ncbi:uncharacterized protein EDB93DRAFT_333713 [Suillus bovinus]|uniref:uncharacterized protein n=1 Tax=Suillus bovinus TaxID=48563 RepID=UPI001B86F54D|nr:uncharacterized protein EDB93DRAFT_333713 [Suillus bovinus]KAG2150743.1 hypothetical protein EDB93DRAFT_333713 [Suillus bovinus]
MSEDNPSRKKRWGLPRLSRSSPRLAEERGHRAVSDPSSLPPSRNGSHGRLWRFLPKSFDKFARSTRQSPNSESMAASSSARDLLHPQTNQDLPPLTTVTPEPNPDQSSDVGVANINSAITCGQPDLKVVKEKLANAQADLDGIRHVPGMAENAASASDNLQSLTDTIDTFAPMLVPLKVFNFIATRLADVHPYAKVALSIFTFASKMILDQANRDDAVSRLLSKISDVYALLTAHEGTARIACHARVIWKDCTTDAGVCRLCRPLLGYEEAKTWQAHL